MDSVSSAEALSLAGVIVAAVSALATGVSAIVIAIQSKHTRASAEASQAAVVVAHETLREAQIARLDALAPQVLVETYDFVVDTPTAAASKQGQAVPEDGILRLPRDGEIRITCAVGLRVRNEGNRSVPLTFSSPFFLDGKSYGFVQQTLKPAEEVAGRYHVTQTFAEWVKRAQASLDGATGDTDTFEIAYSGPGDSDLSEYHRIQTSGYPINKVDNQDSAWTLGELFTTEVKVEALPLERVYWRSRKRGEKF